MKRHLLYALATCCCILLYACQKDDKSIDESGDDSEKYVYLATGILEFGPEASDTRTVSVTASDDSWRCEVERNTQWCNAVAIKEEQQSYISVSVTENSGQEERTAKIYVFLSDVADSLTVVQAGSQAYIRTENENYQIGADGGPMTIKVMTNIEYVASSEAAWITIETGSDGATISVEPNTAYESRTAEITFAALQGDPAVTVTLTQAAATKPERPQTDNTLIEITDVSGITASSAYPLGNLFDGDLSSSWQTPSAGVNAPATMRFELPQPSRVDFMVYYPAEGYGQFGEVDVFYQTAAGIQTFVCSHDFGMKDTPDTIRFTDAGLIQPQAVILQIKTSKGRESTPASKLVISGAEIEFWRTPELKNPLEIFTDYSCSQLLPQINTGNVGNITDTLLRRIASGLADGTYDKKFRIASYKAYRNPDTDSDSFSTDRPYSRFDNVTGMMIPETGTYRVMVGDVPSGAALKMSVVDYNTNENGLNCDYTLKTGINEIEIKHTGLIYIQYYSESYASLPEITIHFPDAVVNGYYDPQKNDPLDFQEMIYEAKCDHFDIIGRKVLMTYPISAFKQYTQTGKRANELLALADSIITLTEEFQGFYKHQGRGRNNRLLIRPIYNVGTANMYATNYSIAFRASNGTIRNVADPTSLKNSVWGPAHEVGHMNAISKSMNWAGCGETMPNLSAAYVNYQLGGGFDSRATTLFNTREEESLAKSCYYDMIYRDFMIPGRAYLLEGGYTEMRYERVIPFWQLHLYASFVKDYPDFYKDLYNYMRSRTDNSSISDAQAQMQFVRVACDLLKEDLTEFFESYGFLTPMKNFYAGSKLINITEEMISEVKAHIAAYPKPKQKVQFINETNLDVFRSQSAPVAGTVEISSDYYVCNGWSGIAVWELVDADGNTLAYSAKPKFKYGINPLFWADINGNPNPDGNINTQKYCYLNKGTITTQTPQGAVVYGITPLGERVAAKTD